MGEGSGVGHRAGVAGWGDEASRRGVFRFRVSAAAVGGCSGLVGL